MENNFQCNDDNISCQASDLIIRSLYLQLHAYVSTNVNEKISGLGPRAHKMTEALSGITRR